jgi:MurNAc alpha-1-phosphate uridylyltransferase
MILAAGRGTRLAPLTATVPKPLIEVGGETLIERHLRRLAAAGVRDVVINLAHLGALIEARLGNGEARGLRIAYSREGDAPLETGGGIARALPLLGDAPFLVVNADIWTEFPFDRLQSPAAPAHLVVVPNPPHNPDGDFRANGCGLERRAPRPYTYAGIGIFSPALFAGRDDAFPLGSLLFELAREGRLTGEIFRGRWFDIGTPDRLEAARRVAG